MNVRMTDNRRSRDKELMTVAVDLRRKRFVGSVGYDLLTVIQSGQLNIQISSEITTKPTEENWSFSVTSNHLQYKEVGLKIIVIPGQDQIFEINIRGHIDTAPLKADFDMICNMWFDGKKGRVKAKLNSYPLSGDSYLEWEWDYLRNMKGLANASYDFYNVSRDFSSYLFFRSTPASLDNVCFGTDISFNNKLWWFNTNVTLMAPSMNDVAFTSFLLLPHNVKEVHSLVGKVHFTKDYKTINQVLKYSTVLSKMGLQTSVQMKMTNGAIDGSIFLEGGVDGAHFLRDDFNATLKNNECDINSVFTSSFTNDDITVGLHYKKPHIEHKITVDLYSPSHEVMVLATVDFETIHNMYTNITCTTPISTFPQIGMTLRAITNQTLFFRFGRLLWPNNSAMFNYTHLRSLLEEAGASINDGRLLVDFPLATRHTILLTYKYQEYQMSSNGLSGLIYNNNSILQGNFSRQQLSSDLELGDFIKINVTNIYMPLGLNYQHKRKKNANNPSKLYTDKKRIEIFRAETPSLGIQGEVNVDRTEQDNTVELNLAHSDRNLKLRTVFCVNNTLYSEAHVYLKPTVWVSSNFFLSRKHTNEESKERLNFELSYPRRNVSVNGAYQWARDELDCYLTLEPGSQSHPITVLLAWQAEDPLSQKAVVLLAHPSLEKNLTMNAHIRQKENAILDLDVELDYALFPQRKLSFHGSLVSKPKKNEKHYELLISAKHPITRLRVDSSGILIKRQGYLFAVKNVSYERAFLPLQFWNSSIKMDLNNREAQLERQSLRDLAFLRAKYSKQGSKYNLEGNIIKGKTTNITGSGYLDPFNFKSSATVNLTSVASEQLLVDGDFVDNRHAYWNVWRKYDDLSVNDMSFSLRLNHSRLLTSSYIWRTSIKQDLVEGFHSACSYLWTYMTETGDFWTDFVKTEVSETLSDIWLDAEPNLQEFIDDITNVEMLKSDIVYFQTVFNESYEANEFFMQDIYNITLILAEEIAFRDKMGDLPKIVSELWQVMGETGESVRQSILYLIETVKNMYMKAVAVCSELLQGNALQNLSQLIGRLSSKYDKMIKDLHVTFINYVELLWTQVATTITDAWNRMLKVIEPAFIEFVHYTDSLFWDCSKKILEFLYQKQSFILSSANLAKDSNFTKDLDKFYKDFTKNGLLTSTKKYSIMLFGMVKEKYFKVVPFGYELTEITSEIYDEIKELYKLPAINFTIDATIAMYDKTLWLYGYFDVGHKIQQALPFVYRKAIDLSHTALQNEIINHQRKTKFVFEPRRGELYLEQLLPMPWHSFSRIPNFEEIKEYKMITDMQKWLTPSNRTFWSLYYEYSPLLDYHNWLPPYKGEAMIGKNHHYITFDKKHYSFRSPCSYLLARDFVRNDFALILKYTNGKHTIDLYIGPYIVEVDLDSDVVNILSHPMSIPANLNGTLVYYEFGMITIDSDMGFTVECNTKHDVCLIKLSGWYYGKTAGLLGTLDNEPSNDFTMSTGEVTKDVLKFTHSWLLDSGDGKCTTHLPAQRRVVSPSLKDKCNNFFASKTSQFSSCFAIVDPEPYKTQCLSSLSDIDNDICTSAIMYIQECFARNIPLRTPNSCVKCQIFTNLQMVEGDFTQLKGAAISQSSDVVFIIEAKRCNNYSKQRKSMPMIVNSIGKELIEAGLTNNRFSVVVFGGYGVFDRPRSMLVNNEIFSSAKYVTPIFTQIPIGSGNSDILMALRFSTKLKFRPGVSKTFVLIPCSLCENNDTSFDYSVLQEVLIEKDVTLHIIMNNDFGLEKARSNRILYGVDANTAFTKNDFKKLKGDKDLRRQVKQAKHLFGYCSHIALDSNGTVFSASKLENLNMNAAKKFVNVFAKRVASSAKPSDCQNCECTADENGIDTIDCSLCVYPTPVFRDFEFKDNSTLFKSFEEDLDNFGNDNL